MCDLRLARSLLQLELGDSYRDSGSRRYMTQAWNTDIFTQMARIDLPTYFVQGQYACNVRSSGTALGGQRLKHDA